MTTNVFPTIQVKRFNYIQKSVIKPFNRGECHENYSGIINPDSGQLRL